jgi:hypothetical protein
VPCLRKKFDKLFREPGEASRRERHRRKDQVLDFLRYCLCCGLIGSLIGCGAMTGQPPRGAPPTEARKPAREAPSRPKSNLPGVRQLGPELDMRQWKIQCSDAKLAMLCRKSDRTDRRCAAKRSGKYRWTYGSYCHAWLPCYKKACR